MLDVLVIGAGQAGLAVTRALQAQGLDVEAIDERTQVGGAWPDYYDSLTLFSPRRYSALPGLAFPGDPDGYPGRDEVVGYLQAYAARFAIPVTLGARVEQARRDGDAWRVAGAGAPERRARALVAATGGFGSPHTPDLPGAEAFRGQRLHAAAYRRPQDHAGLRVVVVGAANSAVQIAVELAQVADVTLATRNAVRYAPQRLLGRDVHFWFRLLGVDNSRTLSDQGTPVLDTGRYRAAIRAGRPARRAMFQRFTETGVVWADGAAEDVDVVIFATGYRPHLPYLDPTGLFDGQGRIAQANGLATGQPGLFFMGQPGLRRFASATLRGVGEDAAVVAASVARHLGR